jgi:hypothetical protein
VVLAGGTLPSYTESYEACEWSMNSICYNLALCIHYLIWSLWFYKEEIIISICMKRKTEVQISWAIVPRLYANKGKNHNLDQELWSESIDTKRVMISQMSYNCYLTKPRLWPKFFTMLPSDLSMDLSGYYYSMYNSHLQLCVVTIWSPQFSSLSVLVEDIQCY